MSGEWVLRGFFALLYSGMFAAVVFERNRNERDPGQNVRRYMSYVSGALLPACVLVLLLCGIVCLDARTALRMLLTFCFGIFLHICVYYLLLLPALPLLRRTISARACAMLWLLPNYLYITQMSWMRLPAPRWVLSAPSGLVQGLAALWLAGFAAVLGGKIVSHLVFRTRILRPARPVVDPAVQAVWRQELEAARFRRPRFRLVVSPAVRTPVSVGLFSPGVRVVLPQRGYTPEELRLIFRHELIHIGREDAWSKFFGAFCTAMCWFAPMMWVAMKRSAEDLELSCDETVLLNASGDTRRQYAGLLLRTAGDERGFTTCLSASAEALRYRMKSVVTPRARRSGALAVGLVFFLLCISCGHVALAYGEETGAQRIYEAAAPEQYLLRNVRWDGDAGEPEEETRPEADAASLHRYLAGLRMQQITGNYSFEPEGRSLQLLFDTPRGVLAVKLAGQYLCLTPLYGDALRSEFYYLPDGVDWERLRACVPRSGSENRESEPVSSSR